MKTLLLLRHAKSSWKDGDLDDHDRPLNKRGKRDAPRMGQLLRDQDLLPELILTSSARRCRKTAEHVIQSSGYRGETRITGELYEAGAKQLRHRDSPLCSCMNARRLDTKCEDYFACPIEAPAC